MGKYSENPIDNLQGYLGNIEMILERMEERQKKLAAAPSPSSDGSELEELKEELSSIRTAIDTIRNDNGLISSSMKTVAGAIGTIPTEEERKKQHQEDLQYIIDNTKKEVTVNLPQQTLTQLNNISSGINDFKAAVNSAGATVSKQIADNAGQLSKPLDKLAATFEQRVSNFVEKKTEKATRNVESYVYENWFWRFAALISLSTLFLLWLYPKIKDMDFPNGIEGFFYGTLIVSAIPLLLMGIYKWGKSNGNSWY